MVRLINKQEFLSIEDINAISSRFGMDVWRYRGGWYHNPNTNKNEPIVSSLLETKRK